MSNADLSSLILGTIMLAPKIVEMDCGFRCLAMMAIMPMEMVAVVTVESRVDLVVTADLLIPQIIVLDLSPTKSPLVSQGLLISMAPSMPISN